MNEKTLNIAPFGLWPSPISAGLISKRMVLDDVFFAGDGQTLVWREGRPSGSVLVAQTGSGPHRDLTDDQSPRAGVGYGGGIFTVSGDALLFANSDGRIYRRDLSSEQPRPITPAFGPTPSGGVASPMLSPDGKWVLYVYSDGSTDLLGLVDATGSNWPTHFAHGADFYMQPTWHPGGAQAAWVEWNHPNMPWDGTRIQLARLEGTTPHIQEVKTVGGGDDVPAQQPLFSPDGRWLSFAEESGEWADLILLDLNSGERRVLVKGDGFDLNPPAWVQGQHSMAWSSDSQRIYYLRNDGQNTSLWFVELAGGEPTRIDTAPYTALRQLSAAPRGLGLAFLASAANRPDEIVRWDGQRLHSVVYSTATTVDPVYLPTPREINWPAEDGTPVHGLYYPPTHPRYQGTGLPPALVHIHGGPTSLADNRFNADAAYFTSRGYAYVEVNYRGSTGFGRTYRHAMRERWGDVDVEDAVTCARMLGERGLADPKRLVIKGGSAGGYTVLNVLVRYPGVYKAGVCLYGVSDLFALDLDTHKFEAQYNATLIGHLPEAAERYHAWSPVFHAGNIRDALYVFQGSEDKVVPLNQAEAIVSALREHNVPYQYKVYEGEGHGFRKPETIADYLKETERFLQKHVLFAA